MVDNKLVKYVVLFISSFTATLVLYSVQRNKFEVQPKDENRSPPLSVQRTRFKERRKVAEPTISESPYVPKGTEQPKEKDLPTIYAVTPTYSRPLQIPELTRLSHTFMMVNNLHWIVIEDADKPSPEILNFLEETALTYTYMNTPTPAKVKAQGLSRGVLQRNLALDWIRRNAKEGVVYFADDDNTYDLKLFEEMQSTSTVSVWPVGFSGSALVEGPVCENGAVIGWRVAWDPNRPFPIDMAGFAINVRRLLERPNAKFRLHDKPGYQESTILSAVTTVDELEPKADMCTKVLVWHTQSKTPEIRKVKVYKVPDV